MPVQWKALSQEATYYALHQFGAAKRCMTVPLRLDANR